MLSLVALSIFAIAAPFVLYPLLLLVHARLAPRPISTGSATPPVSLIICAHDEAGVLAERLENALGLDYPAECLEICLASDGSTDGTVEIARGFEARGVRVLDLPRMGKAEALAAAVASTSGEILAFTDANSHWEPLALRALVRPFCDDRVGGVAGDQRYEPSGQGDETAGERSYWSFDRILKRWQSRSGNVISATGAIHAIRRELFEAPPSDATDDFMISTGVIARGRRLVFCEDAVALEPPARSDSSEFRRKVRIITRGLRAVYYRRRLLDPTRYGIYAVELLLHKLWRRLTWIPLLFLIAVAPFLGIRAGLPALVGWLTIALVALGIAGLLLPRTRRLKPVAIAAYILTVNTACAFACMNALRGRRVSRWEPERAADGTANSAS